MIRKIPNAVRRTLTPIGLDFGTTAVRAVQLRRVGSRYSVVAAIELGLRSERDGEHRKGSSQGLARRIQRALAQQDFRGRQVVMGLSPPDVEFHPLAIPIPWEAGARKQIDSTLMQAAHIEVQRLAGFETKQVETDWWSVPPGRGTDTTAMGVAARSDQVIELCEMCRMMGYECQRIDVSPCATARFGFALHPPSDNQVWGVLDVGARSTRLTICIDDVPVLARAVGGGGQELTQRIAETLEITPESAEVFKRDHGMQLPGSARPHDASAPAPRASDDPELQPTGVAAASPGESEAGELRDRTSATDPGHTGTATQVLPEVASMIYSVLRPNLDFLCQEIERSYAYVLQLYPDRCAGPLLLLGAGAAMKNFDCFLSDRLGIRVTDAEALRSEDRINFSTGGKERLGSLACAIGLAIGS